MLKKFSPIVNLPSLKDIWTSLEKREQFIIFSLLFGLGSYLIFLLPSCFVLAGIVSFSTVIFLFSFLMLREVKEGFNILLLLPLLFVLSTSFVRYFYPYLSLPFRLVYVGMVTVVFYLLLLSLNIFFVVMRRGKIPLLRPAKAGLFFTVVVISFFNFNLLFKVFSVLWMQIVFCFLVSSFLGLLFFSGMRVGEGRDFGFQYRAALVLSLQMVEICFALGFLPLEDFSRALGLAVVFYAFLGIGRDYVQHRLNKKILLEYVLITTAFFVGIFKFLG
ncbi:MAG: hypothetical protein ACOC6Q_01495 [Patescibacteria group bacterium]